MLYASNINANKNIMNVNNYLDKENLTQNENLIEQENSNIKPGNLTKKSLKHQFAEVDKKTSWSRLLLM